MSIPKSCAKWLALILLSLFTACAYSQAPGPAQKPGTAVATFAGGCFWCMEPPFDKLPGVISTTSGYTGGKTKNPTYEQVSAGTTGTPKSCRCVYDPAKVSYEHCSRSSGTTSIRRSATPSSAITARSIAPRSSTTMRSRRSSRSLPRLSSRRRSPSKATSSRK